MHEANGIDLSSVEFQVLTELSGNKAGLAKTYEIDDSERSDILDSLESKGLVRRHSYLTGRPDEVTPSGISFIDDYRASLEAQRFDERRRSRHDYLVQLAGAVLSFAFGMATEASTHVAANAMDTLLSLLSQLFVR